MRGISLPLGVTQRHLLRFPRPEQCVGEIVARASAVSDNKNLLRVYWYDAWYDARTGMTPTATQLTLAHLHGVKLRLGVLNKTGEQKGVDSLIVTDLIDLARNRAIADAVVVSGDEDLRIAVQVAQAYGVRVHILAAGEPNRSVSSSLQMEADSVHHLDREWFKKHLDATASADRTIPVPCACIDALDVAGKAIEEILVGVDSEKITTLAKLLVAKDTKIPIKYDRRLIACAAKHAGRWLTEDEKLQIRTAFIREIHVRNSSMESR